MQLRIHHRKEVVDRMQLTFTDEQTEVLREMLLAYLPELQREVARTDEHTLRHALVLRQDLVELMLQRLGAGAS
jgi:hypothetical protein